MSRKNDKKHRLIQAADELFRQRGINVTTLANIANLAKVPLGNVYYYFKSKDAIIEAVIQVHVQRLKQWFAEWDLGFSQAKARLLNLVQKQATFSQETLQFGDPLGSLCQELSKQGGDLAESASGLFKELYQWCERQFRQLGKSDAESEKLTIQFLSALQGIGVLSLSMKDPALLSKQYQILEDWLSQL